MVKQLYYTEWYKIMMASVYGLYYFELELLSLSKLLHVGKHWLSSLSAESDNTLWLKYRPVACGKAASDLGLVGGFP